MTLSTLSIYPSVEKQLIRTLFEANIVSEKCIQFSLLLAVKKGTIACHSGAHQKLADKNFLGGGESAMTPVFAPEAKV